VDAGDDDGADDSDMSASALPIQQCFDSNQHSALAPKHQNSSLTAMNSPKGTG
jgi:hypothetical protein